MPLKEEDSFLVRAGSKSIAVALLITVLSIVMPIGSTETAMGQSFLSEKLRILDERLMVDSKGNIRVIGELQSVSEKPIQLIQIEATFYDSLENVVGSAIGNPLIDVLRPGEKSVFELTFYDEDQSAKVESFKLFIQVDENARPKPAALELAVGDGYLDDIDMYHLTGEVANKGDSEARFVAISAAFYDSNGKLVEVGLTYTPTTNLGPGETSSFEIIVTNPDTTHAISSSSVNVESVSQSMINPELSIPAEEDTSIAAVVPPTDSNSSAGVPSIDEGKEMYLLAWNNTRFSSAFNTFVEEGSVLGYGVYKEHARNNVFTPGEPISFYVEPVAYSHKPILDGHGNILYLINMTSDYIISDEQGNELQRMPNVPFGTLASHRQNTELFLELTINQDSPFPEGNYLLTYIVHDNVSGESFEITKEVSVATVASSEGEGAANASGRS